MGCGGSETFIQQKRERRMLEQKLNVQYRDWIWEAMYTLQPEKFQPSLSTLKYIYFENDDPRDNYHTYQKTKKIQKDGYFYVTRETPMAAVGLIMDSGAEIQKTKYVKYSEDNTYYVQDEDCPPLYYEPMMDPAHPYGLLYFQTKLDILGGNKYKAIYIKYENETFQLTLIPSETVAYVYRLKLPTLIFFKDQNARINVMEKKNLKNLKWYYQRINADFYCKQVKVTTMQQMESYPNDPTKFLQQFRRGFYAHDYQLNQKSKYLIIIKNVIGTKVKAGLFTNSISDKAFVTFEEGECQRITNREEGVRSEYQEYDADICTINGNDGNTYRGEFFNTGSFENCTLIIDWRNEDAFRMLVISEDGMTCLDFEPFLVRKGGMRLCMDIDQCVNVEDVLTNVYVLELHNGHGYTRSQIDNIVGRVINKLLISDCQFDTFNPQNTVPFPI